MYELINRRAEIDALVFVHGLDVDLADRHRAEVFERQLRELARECGKDAVLIRTNLRQHRCFRCADWEKAHGGALAAVGHVISGGFRQLRIASSWPYFDDHPWGSHWNLDPKFSSSRLSVEHADASLSRQQKIGFIAGQGIAQRYLRVCFENLSDSGNCSRCAKCLRTMLSLKAHGELANFPVFDRDADLVGRLNAVPYLGQSLRGRAAEQLEELADYPDLQAALARLIERREPLHRRVQLALRALGRRIRGAFLPAAQRPGHQHMRSG